MGQIEMGHLLYLLHVVMSHNETFTEAFSKPSDFFLFLSRYAHVLKMQQQSRLGNASMNDATPESEQRLAFPVSPSTY